MAALNSRQRDVRVNPANTSTWLWCASDFVTVSWGENPSICGVVR